MTIFSTLLNAAARVEKAVTDYKDTVEGWRNDEGFGHTTARPWHDGLAESGETEEVAKARWYAIRLSPAEAKAKREAEEAAKNDTYKPVDRSAWLLDPKTQARAAAADAENARKPEKQSFADKLKLFWSL